MPRLCDDIVAQGVERVAGGRLTSVSATSEESSKASRSPKIHIPHDLCQSALNLSTSSFAS